MENTDALVNKDSPPEQSVEDALKSELQKFKIPKKKKGANTETKSVQQKPKPPSPTPAKPSTPPSASSAVALITAITSKSPAVVPSYVPNIYIGTKTKPIKVPVPKRRKLLRTTQQAKIFDIPPEVMVVVFHNFSYFELLAIIRPVCSLWNSIVQEYLSLIIEQQTCLSFSLPEFEKVAAPSSTTTTAPAKPGNALFPQDEWLFENKKQQQSEKDRLSRFELMQHRVELQKQRKQKVDFNDILLKKERQRLDTYTQKLQGRITSFNKVMDFLITPPLSPSNPPSSSPSISTPESLMKQVRCIDLGNLRVSVPLNVWCQFLKKANDKNLTDSVEQVSMYTNVTGKILPFATTAVQFQQDIHMLLKEIERFPKFSVLHIGFDMLEELVKLGSLVNRIQTLKLYQMKEDAGYSAIAGQELGESAYFKDSLKLTFRVMIPVAHQLRDLDLSHCWSMINFPIINTLPQALRKLNLSGCNYVRLLKVSNPNDLVNRCPHLEYLDVSQDVNLNVATVYMYTLDTFICRNSTVKNLKTFLAFLRRSFLQESSSKKLASSELSLVKLPKLQVLDVLGNRFISNLDHVEQILQLLKHSLVTLRTDVGVFQCVHRADNTVRFANVHKPSQQFSMDAPKIADGTSQQRDVILVE